MFNHRGVIVYVFNENVVRHNHEVLEPVHVVVYLIFNGNRHEVLELINVVVYLVFNGHSHEVLQLVNVVVYLVFNGHIDMRC